MSDTPVSGATTCERTHILATALWAVDRARDAAGGGDYDAAIVDSYLRVAEGYRLVADALKGEGS